MAENVDPDGLEAEEAFIASSFIEFHTEKPSSGEWIPMTDAEAGERWTSWLAAHDAEVTARGLYVAAEDIGGFTNIARHGNDTAELNAEAEASTWLKREADRIAGGTSHAV